MNDELIMFVEDLREWLYAVIHGPACFLVTDPKLSEYRAAWPELEARFDELAAKLREMTEKDRIFLGLGGEQLSLKLAAHDGAKRKDGRWPTLKGFKKVLRWAGLIIGSAVEATPAGEAIKEFIELLQNTAEDMEDIQEEEVRLARRSRLSWCDGKKATALD